MLRRLPLIPTLIVLAAVALMIRLGFWQLDRLHEKEALLAHYATALHDQTEIRAAPGFMVREPYRHVRLSCPHPKFLPPMAGHNRAGVTGWAHRVRCDTSDFDIVTRADVVLGWAVSPAPVSWNGGIVTGITAPGGREGGFIVADPPLAGLEPNALPNPSSIPNNHLSYAVQWFLFALVAVVIYGIAVRGRLKS